jgi:uncharacterized repeat protein (TIGR02543 family)
VAINATNFPDEVFRTYVSENIDADDNGYLSDAEISATTSITVKNNSATTKISNLSGIGYFTSLRELDCSHNSLTSLDLSKNTALVKLDCSYNQLTELDVSQNRALTYLSCTNSNLTGLDVSHNTALVTLLCHENPLTELNLSNNTALVELDCSLCDLTTLDVSHNTALVSLFCALDSLSELDLSNNTALVNLECSGCGLTTLDVSQNTALKYLSCSQNEFTTLDVSNNEALLGLDCSHNQLTELDVKENALLQELYCTENKLSSLDVSDNSNLQKMNCSDNQLTTLDVSSNSNLEELVCGENQLTTLDVSNNSSLSRLHCEYNQLTSLDLSGNPSFGYNLLCNNQSRAVTATYSNGMLVVDLENDLNLDMSRVSDVTVTEGTYSDGKAYFEIPVASDAKISYNYNTKAHDKTMDVTLTLASMTVTFETNGGNEIEPQTLAAGESATRPTAPTRTGYSFVDWYADPELTDGTEYDFATPVGQDITLYAKWAANRYTVRFDANGGTGIMADQAFTYDVEQELSANAFTRDGYHFVGWNTEADGTGATYEDQQSVTSLTAEEDGQLTLYAQWEAHDLVKTERVEPTCTEAGREAYWTCSVCGKRFSDAAGTVEVADLATLDISPLGHDFSGTWMSDETDHWHVCSRCGEQSAVEAHAFGAWTHAGSLTRECTVCGYEETGAAMPVNPGRVIPDTGDDSLTSFWAILMLAVSCLGFLAVGRRREP